MKFKNNIARVGLIIILCVSGLGFWSYKNPDFEIIKNLDIYYSLFRELQLFYVDETSPEKLVNKSIEGMLESLDPYTEYIPESEMEDFNFQTTGEYGGIGAIIRKSGNFVMISEPYEDFPAVKSGLKAGDVILEIDGVSTKGKSLPEVSELLKGIPGTEAKIVIKRPPSNKKLEKSIEREKVKIPNVPYFGIVGEKTGYIKLSNFTPGAGNEVKTALNELVNRGIGNLILDLRNNPGGLLLEAVNVSSIFVNKGEEIVSTRGKVKQFDFTYKTQKDPVNTKIPLVVLTNRASASASEIVAGAMQDLDRGIIIGQQTFGKGLVQTTRDVSYNGKLKVTTAKYYMPSGRCIQMLDYTHRNEDGSVGYVPDSLISEFSTRNGRKVYDGGGVRPDVEVEPEMLSNIAVSLYTKNFIFDFATKYAADHDSITAPENFELSEKDYNDFLDFIKGKDFDYQTQSEKELIELIKIAKREKYYDLSEEEFEALKIKLAHDKEKDLRTFQDEIKELLAEEILGRYYYQKGSIRYALRKDNVIKEASAFLNDEKYFSMKLEGGYSSIE